VRCSPVLYCALLNHIVISIYCIALSYVVLYCIVCDCTGLHSIAMYHITLYSGACPILYYIALPHQVDIEQHCATSHLTGYKDYRIISYLMTLYHFCHCIIGLCLVHFYNRQLAQENISIERLYILLFTKTNSKLLLCLLG